jgi:8-amino-7-oxononanoate synthase
VRHNLTGSDIVIGSSLAKAFGVPMAVLSASEKVIRRFTTQSETRVHSSPPSIAAFRAAQRALTVNQTCGDMLRRRLATRVRYFRERIQAVGLASRGGLFPVQTLLPVFSCEPARIYQRLAALNVRSILRRGHYSIGPCISFIVNARHAYSAIDTAVNALTRVVYGSRRQNYPCASRSRGAVKERNHAKRIES